MWRGEVDGWRRLWRGDLSSGRESAVNEVVVLGVGMHRFGRFPALAIQDLAREAIWQAIGDAGIDPKVIEIAYVANCYNGFFTGQLDAIAPIAVKYSGLTA